MSNANWYTCRQCWIEKPECWPCNWFLCRECEAINEWTALTEEELAIINANSETEKAMRDALVAKSQEILERANYKKDENWNYLLPSQYIREQQQ